MKARLTAAKDAPKGTRTRTEKEKAYKKRCKKHRNTNKGRKVRRDNFCRRAVMNKIGLLEEPGLVTLRNFMRHVGQSGPGMRLLHRYRSGDVWNDFGSFMRAFDTIDICTPEELEVLEHNYRLHLAAIVFHCGPGDPRAAASTGSSGDEPDYQMISMAGDDAADPALSSSRCADFDEMSIDWADESDESER